MPGCVVLQPSPWHQFWLLRNDEQGPGTRAPPKQMRCGAIITRDREFTTKRRRWILRKKEDTDVSCANTIPRGSSQSPRAKPTRTARHQKKVGWASCMHGRLSCLGSQADGWMVLAGRTAGGDPGSTTSGPVTRQGYGDPCCCGVGRPRRWRRPETSIGTLPVPQTSPPQASPRPNLSKPTSSWLTGGVFMAKTRNERDQLICPNLRRQRLHIS